VFFLFTLGKNIKHKIELVMIITTKHIATYVLKFFNDIITITVNKLVKTTTYILQTINFESFNAAI